MLNDRELTVTDVVKTFGVSRATIDRHLDPTNAAAGAEAAS
jgi:predicted DNA-binding transcriptional regulator AlpA